MFGIFEKEFEKFKINYKLQNEKDDTSFIKKDLYLSLNIVQDLRSYGIIFDNVNLLLALAAGADTTEEEGLNVKFLDLRLLLNNLSHNLSFVYSILLKKELDSKFKQELIETDEYSYKQSLKQKVHSMPFNLKQLCIKIDSLLDFIDLKDVSLSAVQRNILSTDKLDSLGIDTSKVIPSTDEKLILHFKLLSCLKLFYFFKESPGFCVVQAFSFFLCSIYNNHLFSSNLQLHRSLKSTITDLLYSEKAKGSNIHLFTRTSLASYLVSHFTSNLELLFSKLTKDLPNLSKHDQTETKTLCFDFKIELLELLNSVIKDDSRLIKIPFFFNLKERLGENRNLDRFDFENYFFIKDSLETNSFLADYLVSIFEIFEVLGSSETRTIMVRSSPRSEKFISCNKDFIIDFFSIGTPIVSFPMVCSPLPWIHGKFRNNPEGTDTGLLGGKLLNSKGYLGTLTRFSDSNKFYSNIMEKDLKIINLIQEEVYVVNKEMLKTVSKYLIFCLLSYLDHDKDETPIFYLVKKESGVVVENWLHYLYFDNMESSSLGKMELHIMPERTYLERYSDKQSKERLRLQAFYRKQIARVYSFLQIFYQAYVFQHAKELHFPVFLDFRLRIYPITGLLSYQGNNFAKSLLSHKNTMGLPEYQNKDPRSTELILKRSKEDNKKAYSSKVSTVYSHLADEFNLSNNFVTLDATNSGLSITSALTGCLEGLVLTNVLSKNVYRKEPEIGDLYNTVIFEMQKSTPDFFEVTFLKSVNFRLEKIKVPDELKSDHSSFVKSRARIYLDLICERPVMKDIMIAFLYTEGLKSRDEKLKAVCIGKKLQVNQTHLDFLKKVDAYNSIREKELHYKILYVDSLIRWQLCVEFEKVFYSVLPLVEIFRKILTSLVTAKNMVIAEKKGILLKISNEESYTFYQKFKRDTLVCSYRDFNKNKLAKRTISFLSDKFDFKKKCVVNNTKLYPSIG